MDPESKKLLEETFKLVQDNNNMLHKVRRVQRWAVLWHSLKILLIVGIALGSFYFLEPVINKFITIWNNVSGSQQQELNSNPIQDFLKKF
jgi:hypothetical protein